METGILIVGGIMIGIGLILKLISKKTGYDFNDKRYFKAPMEEEDSLNAINSLNDDLYGITKQGKILVLSHW